MNNNPNLAAALEYASAGYAVFPMHEPVNGGSCSCREKTKCRNPGKHPRVSKGFKAASTDAATVQQWWEKYPNANVGIATGRASDLIVIDVDSRSGGDDSFDALLAGACETWPTTRTVITGNGVHYWFRCPAVEIFSSAGLLGPGIDVRGEKGCVVAPPSLHMCARNYQFVSADTPISAMPDWLVERLTSPSRAASSRSLEVSKPIPIGSRNNELTRYAGGLRAAGYAPEAIYAALVSYNQANCLEPLPDSELANIRDSICNYTAGKPKRAKRRSDDDNFLWWFQLSIRHWQASIEIAMMTAEQKGWYMELKVRAWANRAMLPADLKVLARLAGAEWASDFEDSAHLVLAEYELREIEGKWHYVHPGFEQAYAEKLQLSEDNRRKGKESARKRGEQKELPS